MIAPLAGKRYGKCGKYIIKFIHAGIRIVHICILPQYCNLHVIKGLSVSNMFNTWKFVVYGMQREPCRGVTQPLDSTSPFSQMDGRLRGCCYEHPCGHLNGNS